MDAIDGRHDHKCVDRGDGGDDHTCDGGLVGVEVEHIEDWW